MAETESNQASSQVQPCPYCAEPVLATAQKCKHCNEYIGDKRVLRKATSKLVAYVGLVTAVLSLFYALREGYFYIQKQQLARNEIASYLAVADEFESMQSDEYALRAIQSARALSPNDIALQRREFLLHTELLLGEMTWRQADQSQLAQVQDLVINGYRLLQAVDRGDEKSRLLVLLGRLLPIDNSWKDPYAAEPLFLEALQMAPNDPEATFRYGQWLLEDDNQWDKGIGLIKKATTLAPERAFYFYQLGAALLKRAKYLEAYGPLQQAIVLGPQQSERLDIQAGNLAKTTLFQWFMGATKSEVFGEETFYSLDLTAQRNLLAQLLEIRSTDRQLNKLAARFYVQDRQWDLAENTLRKILSQRDLDKDVEAYNLAEFELYRLILQHKENTQREVSIIERKLEAYYERQGYTDVMEWGLVDRHIYKIGLRVELRKNAEPLTIRKAFSHYPFAKAGVLDNDVLTQVAHRELTSVEQLLMVMDNFSPGTEVPIVVKRRGERLELKLIVE